MSKYVEIFNYMRQCPQLSDLWSIGAQQNYGVNVILPQGASPATQYQEIIDVTNVYHCEIVPYLSVYEDYQINCFQFYDVNDSNAPNANINVMSLEEVQSICDWVKTQNENNNLPQITGEKVVSIECYPFVPQIRYVDAESNIIAYFITIRIRYVNKTKRKFIKYALDD